MFKDRKDAGEQLGQTLAEYKGIDALVLAIPRGGVEVGCYVAQALALPLSMIVVRKLPLPDNPEAGFGAIAEDGSTYFADRTFYDFPEEQKDKIIEQQKHELQRRIQVLRGGRPLPEINGKTVILVDDGIAMGSTMRAAVMLCRKRNAGRVVVAAPVAGPATAEAFHRIADRVVILETPPFFRAVAQVYRNWYDVSDQEVIRLLRTRTRHSEPSY